MPDTITIERNGKRYQIPTDPSRPRETPIDYLARKTRGHGEMCPCTFCEFARVA